MKKLTSVSFLFLISALFAGTSHSTGRMTCDSGDKSNWKSEEALIEKITAEGWQVRKVKEDGGCYEVYGRDPEDRRVEAYFDPLTLENLLIARRGKILYKKN
ncbi:MAG: PepSY domain-containing protein [Granulosicoccus sp.]